MDKLAKLRTKLVDNRDATMDKLDKLETKLAETRNTTTALWQDLWRDLDQRTMGFLKSL